MEDRGDSEYPKGFERELPGYVKEFRRFQRTINFLVCALEWQHSLLGLFRYEMKFRRGVKGLAQKQQR